MNLKPISLEKMREVDRLMVEEYGVSTTIMMENASRNIAACARILLDGSVKDKDIVVLAGKGNNGGDGLGAARHLINWGGDTSIVLATSVSELRENAGLQYGILANISAPIHSAQHTTIDDLTRLLKSSDLVIDALLGYNLNGNPQEPYATLIELANEVKTPILSIDIPSGLDGDTGEPHTPTVHANTTITLALPKTGLMEKEAKEYVGNLYVGDLSVPQKVYERMGIEVPLIFEKGEVVRLF